MQDGSCTIRQALRGFAGSSGWGRTRRSQSSSARCSKAASSHRTGPPSRRNCSAGKATDQKRAASLIAAAEARDVADKLEHYLSVFLTDGGTPRKGSAFVTKDVGDEPEGRAAREQDRVLRAHRQAQGRARRRAHGGALHARGRNPRPRRAGEDASRRARLPGSHRQDPGAALARRHGLGALQARSRHRPRADRRGAGHEPRAMGDPAQDHRGFHRGRRRERPARAHALCGRRSQAVDLRLPRSSAPGIRDDPPELVAEGARGGACISRTCR